MEVTGSMSGPPLHLIWLLDFSSSMLDTGKLHSMRFAVAEFAAGAREALGEGGPPPLGAPTVVSVLGFSSGVRWLCRSEPLERFDWSDSWTSVPVTRATDLGAAFREVAEHLSVPPMPKRSPTPVLVLATDGQPTDDWRGGLYALDAAAWGRPAGRIAVRIGYDVQEPVLRAFTDGIEPCETSQAGYEIFAALCAAETRDFDVDADADAVRRPPVEDEFGFRDEEADVAW